ncbi:inhibitor of nuclear factor kappa-B kinase-interacting protein isoform 1-T1 [Fundulus diaphanus]
MPAEIKQRKKTHILKQNDENLQNSGCPTNSQDERQKAKTEDGENSGAAKTKTSSGPDLKALVCLLSLVVSGVLSWVVLQQNERFSLMEEKYRALQGKTSSLLDMEEEMVQVSKKLAASEADLQEARAAVSTAARLQRDISALHGVVVAMQDDENSASRDLQAVNARFLNVTETWQERLAAVSSDLAALKAESRDAHGGATERVNEAEQQARALAKRLEELEDSTKRNARVLERTEEDDAQRAQDQLDWNTRQIQKLQEQIGSLTKREAELRSELQEYVPRAQQCEEHLPQVEEAVRSILKLSGDLSGAERRLEEVTLQVFGTEDSMLKALNEILEMRRELDTLQAQNSILRMKNELSVVKEAVQELTLVLRGTRDETQTDPGTLEDEEWKDEEDEPWLEDE